jgi:hypothetical protein
MEINNIDEQTFGDIFSLAPAIKQQSATFSSNTDNNVDILTQQEPPKEEIKDDKQDQNLEKVEDKKDVDILTTEKKDEKTFSDASFYFEDRLKSGKFVAITEDKEDGSKVPFIPRTPEEFDEVIEIQVNYKLEQKEKELEEAWYTSKSPAWQAVGKYAEMTDNPADILPFIQGIRNIEAVSELDPEDISQAERIVRARLQKKGDDEDMIEETIESLKTTDKLVSTAQKYKPAMVTEEKQELANMVNEKRAEQQQYLSLVNNIREGAVKAIEAPIFGSQKMKQEEKAAIYDLIAQPSRETKGYQIYTVIDSLFEKGDFETLKQIALLATNKESLFAYIASAAANKTSETLQKKLRISAEGNSGGKDTYTEEGRPIVKRDQYKTTPRFGR